MEISKQDIVEGLFSNQVFKPLKVKGLNQSLRIFAIDQGHIS
jgi:hypothetical protein